MVVAAIVARLVMFWGGFIVGWSSVTHSPLSLDHGEQLLGGIIGAVVGLLLTEALIFRGLKK